ncbi:MAG: type II toxin-antitoxin system VapC family toxin [Desulfobacteraceae bacterium]|jgi:PIN domain nuclease of toxin-antitoxin system
MTKYLLDTHIFLWSLLDPSCLSEDVANELDNPANELWLSPITTWEVVILSEKGRIQLDAPPISWVKNVLSTLPFHEATLNHEVAMESRNIRLAHKDPADRFIAESASVYGLTLVTADRNLINGASGYSVFANE